MSHRASTRNHATGNSMMDSPPGLAHLSGPCWIVKRPGNRGVSTAYKINPYDKVYYGSANTSSARYPLGTETCCTGFSTTKAPRRNKDHMGFPWTPEIWLANANQQALLNRFPAPELALAKRSRSHKIQNPHVKYVEGPMPTVEADTFYRYAMGKSQRGRWNNTETNTKLYPLGRTVILNGDLGATSGGHSCLRNRPPGHKDLYRNTKARHSKKRIFSYLAKNAKYLRR